MFLTGFCIVSNLLILVEYENINAVDNIFLNWAHRYTESYSFTQYDEVANRVLRG